MEKFKFITHGLTDAYFNLASEEYLLKQTDGYYIYLWINAPAVIVGTNQNTIEEVNLSYAEEKGIKVVRRLTGGGAVYHDLENICYTIIAPYDETVDNYKKFTEPVINYLNELGVKAEFSGRNDITIGGMKISGNAQTVYKNRIMHHGTILFNTDMSVLEKVLKPNKLKIESKGIKSIRARVTNVYNELPVKMTALEFKEGLSNFLKKSLEEYSFNDDDLSKINKLVKEKYSTFEWNVGLSPKGKNNLSFKFDFGIFTFNFDTINGKIQNAEIFGDFFSKKPIEEFACKLNGVDFNKEKLEEAFNDIDKYVVKANGKEIVDKIF